MNETHVHKILMMMRDPSLQHFLIILTLALLLIGC